MAVTQKLKNMGFSTLLAGITDVATALDVQAGHGARFSAAGAPDYFRAIIYNAAGAYELIKVTTRVGDGFTVIVRNEEGTTNVAWLAGDRIREVASAQALTDFVDQKVADEDVVAAAYTDSEILANVPQLLHVREEQVANTAGGTFTTGAWQTRTLNTSKTNEISGASLAANQITLPAGVYEIEASAPAYQVSQHKARLYNVTDAADVIIGSSEFSRTTGDWAMTSSHVRGRFTLAAQKVLELQHRGVVTRATDGFGIASNLDSKIEIYTEVMIWKLPWL